MINQENHRKEGHEDVYLEECSMNIQQSIWTEFVRYPGNDRLFRKRCALQENDDGQSTAVSI